MVAGSLNNENIGEAYLNVARIQLVDLLEQLTRGKNNYETCIPGLILHRWEHPTEPVSYMHEPSICVIAQGKKRVILGDETYVYDANNFLVTSLDLPIIANILEASQEHPYLGITYHLNQKEITHILLDDFSAKSVQRASKSIAVSAVSLQMLNAILRLTQLIKEQENIKILAPLIQKEILYRLMVSEQGPKIREIGMSGSKEHQIAKAVKWLKENYKTQLKVEQLASYVMMSSSSLHKHFKEMTNMSPLQYQKWLRLHEARRLMLTEKIDASCAAFSVGYESPSQFSKEYKRLFGNPPLRDIKKMNE